MVELAKQAFTTKNFDLAVDVYERIILEKGPNVKLYLGLADSFARAGHIGKAFDAYISACRLGMVTPENLDHLVTGLINIVVDNTGIKEEAEERKESLDNPFSCGACKSLCCEPVTIQCGHTFCKRCLEKQSTKMCQVCKQITRYACNFSGLKPNVLLSKTIESWFSDESKAVRLKIMGNKYFEQQKYSDAITYYTEAFKLASTDHLIASNRSYANFNLGRYKEALEDAEKCIQIKPDWAKGYYRKACALSELLLHEDAAFAYLQCLCLDPSVTSARSSLASALHKLLNPSEGVSLKHSPLNSSLSNPLIKTLVNNSHTSQLDTSLSQLRQSLIKSLRQHNDSTEPAEDTEGTETRKSFSEIDKHQHSNIFINLRKCSSAPCLMDTQSPGSLSDSSYSQLNLPSVSSDKLHRKRTKAEPLTPPEHSSPPGNPAKQPRSHIKYVMPEKLNKDDFDCSLCYRLLCHPVTSPCGHTFCRECLDRCLDHSPNCPLCKASLSEYLAERRSAVTESIDKILQIYFPKEFAIRQKVYEDEMAVLAYSVVSEQFEIPLFVCTIAYPRVSCPLHVFEPRYRLMIRQCMESGTRQFGMITCLEDDERNHVDYGTLLEIRDVQYFPDGRSVVDCVGGGRFKVISRGQRDGFCTGKVQLIRDQPLYPDAVQEVQTLHDEVLQLSLLWYNSLDSATKQRITTSFGQFPAAEQNSIRLPNGPAWHWWLIAILPIDPKAQVSVLSMTNLKDRMLAVRRVITYVQRRSTVPQ